mgnify:CR=1 FL=1
MKSKFLGIVGLVCCFPVGIAAWIMGNGDLKAMAEGHMDPTGEGMTKAGKICGIISVILNCLGIIVWVAMIALGVGRPAALSRSTRVFRCTLSAAATSSAGISNT